MTDSPAPAIRERLQVRIHSLVDRGRHICVEYEPRNAQDPGGPMSTCNRCGYTADVHLLRDTLDELDAALSASPAEPFPLEIANPWAGGPYDRLDRPRMVPEAEYLDLLKRFSDLKKRLQAPSPGRSPQETE